MSDAVGARNGVPCGPGATTLVLLGVLSLALFFVPVVAPLIQVGTLAAVLWAARRRSAGRLGLAVGAGGAALGLILFLALQYVWII